MSDERFFSFDPESGITFHATADEARKAAQDTLNAYEDVASDDGWDEMVVSVCWGFVHGRVVETARMPWAEHLRALGQLEDGDPVPSRFDEFVSYRLKDEEEGEEASDG